MKKYKTQRGFLILEFFAVLGIFAVIFFLLATVLNSSRRMNHLQFQRQRCLASARGSLDSIAATGKPISAEDNARLWPKVATTVEQTAGTGQYEGLTLITVTSKTKAIGKYAQIKLARYFQHPMEQ
jgi:type II secretory pathway pseudopilin PulG